MNDTRLQPRRVASTRVLPKGSPKEQETREVKDRYGISTTDQDPGKYVNKTDVNPGVMHALENEESEEDHKSNPGDLQPDMSSPNDSTNPVSDSPIQHVSCFAEAQLSPDGSTILTTSYSRAFSAYPIPSDFLDLRDTQPLTPYASFTSADPIRAFTPYPHFNLYASSTTLVLLSQRDQHIRLINALWSISSAYESHPSGPVDISTKVASYKLICPLTERVIAPYSLAFTYDGSRFLAGSENLISVFDVERTNEGPISKLPTIPSTRNKRKGGGVGFKGCVSTMNISNEGVLAVGTWSRRVGIYDSEGLGDTITSFPLPQFSLPGQIVTGEAMRNSSPLIGTGITSVKWSPCSKYLYIAERKSDAILIYDIRNMRIGVSYLVGRKANTNQRLGFDLWDAGTGEEGVGHEAWAGGTDGNVRVWRGPHLKEGAVEADKVMKVSEDPVASVCVHHGGGIAAVASGRLDVEKPENDSETENDSKSDGKMEIKGRMLGGKAYARPRMRERGALDILAL
ncbi:hypothetical protein K469DRAFT_700825 [Zopfia rhizophila CBS 207.26]|uniref:WD40 repeat-like protein n=1 Tax=Zopfia rhizophila CBS 207.26 TaxID=1314779 RepID=A0A6A6ECM3_9PEZI|nr:hypothetical protein K469DRAFT_700825 [Zopfia rhizophila CBS 207.26]